jgi:hypothetical protein
LRLTADEFRRWPTKRITVLGMSGVGKTRLANILRCAHWFHYSVDYRIGTRYLDEAILDDIKRQAMRVPFLRDLLRSDSIYIRNNISVDHLKPLSAFLGKLGNPELGGLSLPEFQRRQTLHHAAEVSAMRDVPEFIHKAHDIYGYDHFVNDASGSACELDDHAVMEQLAEHGLILYIQASEQNESELIRRAEADPKPLYYRPAFLDEYLPRYLAERGLDYVAMVEPDDFVRWVFPHLFQARTPRYESIARMYGYTVSSDELAAATDERSFLDVVEKAIALQP